MRRTIRKLFIGNDLDDEATRHSTLRRRWENVVAIWNNTYEEDAGLEKLVRLLLAFSQFLFPGVYIKHLFWRQGARYQDLAMELFILAKTALPLAVMSTGMERQPLLYWLVVWLMLETLLYIPTMIFASDALPTPRNYRRAKLLIFLNYLEVVFSFALLHLAGQYFNQPLATWTDAAYVSFMVTSTIGFGEYFPITGMGKLLVSLQSLFYLSYIALFISFFGLGGNKGYFERLSK